MSGDNDPVAVRTIALVDDDRNILTSVSMALEAEGFQVLCYADGESAWRSLQVQSVDLRDGLITLRDGLIIAEFIGLY